jgi:transposase-like protein
MKKATKFSTEFKVEAVRRMAEAPSIVGLAEELGVRRKLLYQWRDRLQAEGSAGLERRVGRPRIAGANHLVEHSLLTT